VPFDTALKDRAALFHRDHADDRSGDDDPLAVRLACRNSTRAPVARPGVADEVQEDRRLGAGFMGAGIAYVTAKAGIPVVLLDRDMESADKGKAHSESLISDQVKKGARKPKTRTSCCR
jgi:3-hydroxyacyl-CoA dehydrogenase/enoyl-CoA hydratase/3-hydroxybutyryl-CoA epimerase